MKKHTERLKAARGWHAVRTNVPKEHLPIVRAIAAVMTVALEAEEGEPWTEDQVLETALSDGLEALERKYLGTNSLSPSAPSDGEPKLPLTTPMMQALVRALAVRS